MTILQKKDYLFLMLICCLIAATAYVRPSCSLYNCLSFGFTFPWNYWRNFAVGIILLLYLIMYHRGNRRLTYFVIGIAIGYFLAFEIVPVNCRFFGAEICGK